MDHPLRSKNRGIHHANPRDGADILPPQTPFGMTGCAVSGVGAQAGRIAESTEASVVWYSFL